MPQTRFSRETKEKTGSATSLIHETHYAQTVRSSKSSPCKLQPLFWSLISFPAHRVPLGFPFRHKLLPWAFFHLVLPDTLKGFDSSRLFQSTSKRDLLKWGKIDLTIPTYLIRLL